MDSCFFPGQCWLGTYHQALEVMFLGSIYLLWNLKVHNYIWVSHHSEVVIFIYRFIYNPLLVDGAQIPLAELKRGIKLGEKCLKHSTGKICHNQSILCIKHSPLYQGMNIKPHPGIIQAYNPLYAEINERLITNVMVTAMKTKRTKLYLKNFRNSYGRPVIMPSQWKHEKAFSRKPTLQTLYRTPYLVHVLRNQAGA